MAITLGHMFEGVRPFDWLMPVIEALVFIVIVFAEIAAWMRRHKETKGTGLWLVGNNAPFSRRAGRR